MNEHITSHTEKSAFELYSQTGGPILLESLGVNYKYDKTDIVVATAALEIEGDHETYTITSRSSVGEELMRSLNQLPGTNKNGSLEVRCKHSSQGIHTLIDTLKCEHPFMGLYGAFGYDMVREVANIGNRFSKGKRYKLILPSNLFVFGDTNEYVQLEVNGIRDRIGKRENSNHSSTLSFDDISLKEYEDGVRKIVADIHEGRFMQCVLSRMMARPSVRPSFESYTVLRENNPSPYSFFFDFGKEQLFGASPELHLRVDEGIAEVRPIAGTIRRHTDPIIDFQQRVQLQTDTK